jgi:hypothetical protein
MVMPQTYSYAVGFSESDDAVLRRNERQADYFSQRFFNAKLTKAAAI